jgi:hypothetical protein
MRWYLNSLARWPMSEVRSRPRAKPLAIRFILMLKLGKREPAPAYERVSRIELADLRGQVRAIGRCQKLRAAW